MVTDPGPEKVRVGLYDIFLGDLVVDGSSVLGMRLRRSGWVTAVYALVWDLLAVLSQGAVRSGG